MSCGRIRKPLEKGLTWMVDGELQNLKAGFIKLGKGEEFRTDSGEREYAFVLISGECTIKTNELEGVIGPRKNPYEDKPWGIMLTRDESVQIKALTDTLLGVGSAPAKERKETKVITPEMTGGGPRGKDNWQREVHFVCWSDNTEGNMLLAGETCIPEGNWSTIPPHRHQFYVEDTEVPYDEAYCFLTSHPNGFGLAWQFDDDMDNAYSIKNGDVIYMSEGYHPIVNGPGNKMYQLTLMAGPYRTSRSAVHEDYKYLLEGSDMVNPYKNQYINRKEEK